MRHDAEYLVDMLDAAKTIRLWAANISEEEFVNDKLLQSAILFQLMIIGETASGISEDIRSRYQNIEWKSLRGFRNIIVHSYFRLSLPIVWSAADTDARLLVEEVEKVLKVEFPLALAELAD